jgi:hypothetical protein
MYNKDGMLLGWERVAEEVRAATSTHCLPTAEMHICKKNIESPSLVTELSIHFPGHRYKIGLGECSKRKKPAKRDAHGLDAIPQKKYVLAKVPRSEALDFVSNINPVPKRIAKENVVGCAEESRVRH